MQPKRMLLLLAGIALLSLAAIGWQTRGFGLWAGNGGELTLYGNVDIRQSALAFRQAGRIVEVMVEEGDAVSAGQPLARLDDEPLAEQLAVAQAQLAAAQARLAELEAGTRSEEIDQARAQVAEAEAAREQARRTLARIRGLRASGAASQQRLDDAEAAFDTASARLNTAQAALRLALAGPRSEQVDAARAAVAAAEAQVAQAQTASDDALLHAPAAGTVLTRVREPGAVVNAGAPVVTLALAAPVWVRAYINEPDLGRIAPGMAAQVISDSRPEQPYRAHIGFISPQAEFTPKSVETASLRSDLVYRLRVVVDGDPTGLRQGMPVTVRLPEARPDPAQSGSKQ